MTRESSGRQITKGTASSAKASEGATVRLWLQSVKMDLHQKRGITLELSFVSKR
jgi:hypothetical protein